MEFSDGALSHTDIGDKETHVCVLLLLLLTVIPPIVLLVFCSQKSNGRGGSFSCNPVVRLSGRLECCCLSMYREGLHLFSCCYKQRFLLLLYILTLLLLLLLPNGENGFMIIHTHRCLGDISEGGSCAVAVYYFAVRPKGNATHLMSSLQILWRYTYRATASPSRFRTLCLLVT